MKFDYAYLGAQLLITAVSRSIIQQTSAAGNTALGWNAPPSLRGTSETAADHLHRGNGLARDDLVLRLSLLRASIKRLLSIAFKILLTSSSDQIF